MRLFWRFLGWTTFLGFLAGVGAVVFLEIRYRPRCVIAGSYHVKQLSADGADLLTVGFVVNPRPPPRVCGPVQVWDTHTGQARFTFPDSIGLRGWVLSPNQRVLAITLPDNGTLRLLDWRQGTEQSVQLGRPQHANAMLFSPKGAWLWVRMPNERPADFFIHVPTQRVVLQRDAGFIEFNTDDRTMFVRGAAEHEITVWDLEAGKKIGALATKEGPWHGPSPDGRYYSISKFVNAQEQRILEDHPVGLADREFADRELAIWDLSTFTERYRYAYRHESFLSASFSASSRHAWIMKSPTKNGQHVIAVIDMASGRAVLTEVMDSVYHDFSADGKFLCVSVQKQRTAMIELSSGRTIWEKPMWGAVRFAGSTGILLFQDHRIEFRPAELIDVRTGEQTAVVPIHSKDPNPTGKGLDEVLPRLTQDCRHLLAAGIQKRSGPPNFLERWLVRWWPEQFDDNVPAVAVMETTTGRVLFRVLKGAGRTQFLSDDGSTLATVDEPNIQETVIRVWDVQSHRAWTWALTVSALCGLGLWSLRRGVRWLRGRRLAKPKEQAA